MGAVFRKRANGHCASTKNNSVQAGSGAGPNAFIIFRDVIE